MCGIVGYIGPRQAQEVLLRGLERLEYRGYDSAGIAVIQGKSIEVVKGIGRVAALRQRLADHPLTEGTVGIGHTRWATHGAPSERNSHPHYSASRRFVLVHNGIIENYVELKEELIEKGYTFASDTDSEVVAHLLDELYDGDVVRTVQKVIQRLEGAYALGILSVHEPDRLIAVRHASPLVIGAGKGENYIASDISALLEYTRDMIILENGEMAVLTADGVEVMTTAGKPVARTPMHIDWDMKQAEKEGFDHFLIKEIHEQPKAFHDTMSGRVDLATKRIKLENELKMTSADWEKIDRIYVVACGTSYHAGLVGKRVFEQLLRIPVEVEVASEFRYRDVLVTDHTLVIVISQSGETADTLAAMQMIKAKGAKVLAITNVVASSVAREADEVLYTWAGPEISVASTKAYTSQLLVLYMLGLYVAQIRGTLTAETVADYVTHLEQLPAQVEKLLEAGPQMKKWAQLVKEKEHLFFLGRGIDYAVALEGSLKLKEISYIHSEAYPAGELKHGTLALIEEGTPVVTLAVNEELYDKTFSNMIEVKARGAEVYGITWEGNRSMVHEASEVVFIPKTLPLFTPALTVIPLQLFAYYASVARGNDVDKPRNLAKSVTVE
ncbi:glutamine--fructose-6-phosphate transaminase (isomerizing) [Rubeoparvulum massiliense]|uniref:glutamine--fructose-6-phosphate transaminase (isomerizing) n=1 Tax=Rubeoparvulum massiliense TaxID=1631346 RepID=UPI00065E5D91|nr:glutamine--fructose-6-phosphate transaminase (isomerizing) [Rubeoparvulum massiliense]